MAGQLTVQEIAKSIVAGKISPVYLLMGQEAYYIDYLTELILKYAMPKEEKELNQTIMYGNDVNCDVIIKQSLRYPILSDRQIVVVKELQQMDDNLEDLIKYIDKPQKTTVLVLCYKNGTIDKRKKIVTEISKVGIVFESDRIKENALPQFILSYCRRSKFNIDQTAIQILVEYIGSDLSRMSHELDKLFITCRNNVIVKEDVINHIGVSKEYNLYEFRDAIISKNIGKANIILNYMENHPKAYPIQATLSSLFNFFSNLMLAYYAPAKDSKSVASFLNLKAEFMAKDYIKAMNVFTGRKVMNIINEIKKADAKSKGYKNINGSHLIKDLLFYILH